MNQRYMHNLPANLANPLLYQQDDARRLGAVEYNAMYFSDNGFGEMVKTNTREVFRFFESV